MGRVRFFSFAVVLLLTRAALAQSPITATSPDGQIRVEFVLRKTELGDSVPHYRVTYRDKEVIGYSRLGFDFEGGALGDTCDVVSNETHELRDAYTQVTGKRREIESHCSEMTVLLQERAKPKRKWEVVFRLFNDGVGFRFRFPAQEGWDKLAIAKERTEFRLSGDAKVFALPLNGFTTSYEKRYERKSAKDVPKEWLLGMPLLIESQDGIWSAITEANVDEYAGAYLARTGEVVFSTRLSPLPREPGVAVRSDLPHKSPWRVIMIADRVGGLIESDIVLNLNEPCAIQDPTWIKTGKTTFPWWNGFYEKGVSFVPGLNTATAKYYIDFCAEASIPYHSLDGIGNTAWYGGPIVPYEGADPTKAIEGLDLPEVLKYAKAKGIKIRLWMHWGAAAAYMEKAFPVFRDLGIEGIMLDFMDRDDQEMNRFVRKAVKLAAENQLTITLHGCPKPTGLERTYPNLLTHEGVMNLEYDKWDKVGITPEHEVTVPFTRMLAGPLDFHQGSFRAVKPAAFKPQNEAPLVVGTPARTLASYIVFQNHLSMVADYPSAYRGHPALPLLAAIPTTWDETKVIDAQIGNFIVVARRSGKEWFVGAMCDEQGRTISIPLSFLQPGEYDAQVVTDDDSNSRGLAISKQDVTANTTLTLKLSEAGGSIVRIASELAR
jgi:alpha-glucosidase